MSNRLKSVRNLSTALVAGVSTVALLGACGTDYKVQTTDTYIGFDCSGKSDDVVNVLPSTHPVDAKGKPDTSSFVINVDCQSGTMTSANVLDTTTPSLDGQQPLDAFLKIETIDKSGTKQVDSKTAGWASKQSVTVSTSKNATNSATVTVRDADKLKSITLTTRTGATLIRDHLAELK